MGSSVFPSTTGRSSRKIRCTSDGSWEKSFSYVLVSPRKLSILASYALELRKNVHLPLSIGKMVMALSYPRNARAHLSWKVMLGTGFVPVAVNWYVLWSYCKIQPLVCGSSLPDGSKTYFSRSKFDKDVSCLSIQERGSVLFEMFLACRVSCSFTLVCCMDCTLETSLDTSSKTLVGSNVDSSSLLWSNLTE